MYLYLAYPAALEAIMRGCEKIAIQVAFMGFSDFYFEEAILKRHVGRRGWPLQNENPRKSHRNQPNPNFFTASAHPVFLC